MISPIQSKQSSIAIIGLGYVGLPLALAFARHYKVIGFDINASRIALMQQHIDPSNELHRSAFEGCDIRFTHHIEDLKACSVYIVAVPTDIDDNKVPDLKPLLAASATVGKVISPGDYVVFESTVYPGCTEEDCIPIIEEISGLKYNQDFKVGYSPERINPGDKSRPLSSIVKIVSGSDADALENITALYSSIIHAGLFQATSIKVAEAAKILENTQRDVNIALMNQMMMLFDKMGIRSSDVIAAASSKWNFHHYRPGLVGGHCIAVDPYFLVDAGRRHGLSMELVSAARAVNEQTAHFLVEKVEHLMPPSRHGLQGKKILVLGRSFKEDCPDTRNSKAFPLMDALWSRGADVYNFDPVAFDDHFEGGRGAQIIDDPAAVGPYDAIIFSLAHTVFFEQFDPATLAALAKKHAPLIDMRGNFECDANNDWFNYWRP